MKVSNHAINRFRERTGCKRSVEHITKSLLNMQGSGQEVKLKKQFRVVALLNHDCKEARYFKANDMILVVEGDCLVTIHKGTADRWEGI